MSPTLPSPHPAVGSVPAEAVEDVKQRVAAVDGVEFVRHNQIRQEPHIAVRADDCESLLETLEESVGVVVGEIAKPSHRWGSENLLDTGRFTLDTDTAHLFAVTQILAVE
jgi:hypothetical protein